MSDEDRQYLLDRGREDIIARLDFLFPEADEAEGYEEDEEEGDDEEQGDDYDAMTKDELAAELRDRGLPVGGRVDELRQRLRDADAAE